MTAPTESSPGPGTAAGARGWLCSIVSDRLLVALIAGAAVVRLGYLLAAGIDQAGDTPLYLTTARELSDGTVTVNDFPLHLLYSFTLAPAFVFGIEPDTWVVPLHLLLGVATVAVMYRLATLFLERGPALLVGAGAAMLPAALHWSHYILSETLFLFIVSVFLLACAQRLVDPQWDRLRLGVVAALGLLVAFTRPSGVLIVWSATVCLVGVTASHRRDAVTARRAVGATVIASLLVLAAVLAVPATRHRLLGLPTVYTSIWLSTRTFDSDIDHVAREIELPKEIEALDDPERGNELRERSFEFIREHPGDYVSRAGIRFTNFWFPWLTARWSRAHLALDAAVSLSLVGLSICGLVLVRSRAARNVMVMLALVALVQGVLVAFSQLDSEGRYRLPAELALLPVAGAGVQGLWHRLRQRRAAPAVAPA